MEWIISEILLRFVVSMIEFPVFEECPAVCNSHSHEYDPNRSNESLNSSSYNCRCYFVGQNFVRPKGQKLNNEFIRTMALKGSDPRGILVSFPHIG